MTMVTGHMDGSCLSNGKDNSSGGWCFIVNGVVVKHTHRIQNTTSNRMELTAAIECIKYIKCNISPTERSNILLHSDSEYLVKGITQWVNGWRSNGWRTSAKGSVLNKDLWECLVSEVEYLSPSVPVWTHVPRNSTPEITLCDKHSRDP
jgi:ribonuclease HI